MYVFASFECIYVVSALCSLLDMIITTQPCLGNLDSLFLTLSSIRNGLLGITHVSAYVMKSTEVQTLGANIWPGVDALKSCCACVRL